MALDARSPAGLRLHAQQYATGRLLVLRLGAVGAQQSGFLAREIGKIRMVEELGNPVEVRRLHPAAVRQECLSELVGTEVSGPQLPLIISNFRT